MARISEACFGAYGSGIRAVDSMHASEIRVVDALHAMYGSEIRATMGIALTEEATTHTKNAQTASNVNRLGAEQVVAGCRGIQAKLDE